MKLLLKRFALLAIVFGLTIAFIGCNPTDSDTTNITSGTDTSEITTDTTTEAPPTAAELFASVPARIIISGADSITGNFLLPSEVLGVAITYTASNTELVTIASTPNADGFYLVTVAGLSIPLGDENTSVTITGTMSYDDSTETFTKTIRILAQDLVFVDDIADAHDTLTVGNVTELTGIVYSMFDGGFFIYDGSGYMCVFDYSIDDVEVGDEIALKGTYARYYTLYQIKPVDSYEIISSDNPITVTPEVLENAGNIRDLDSDADRTINGSLFTVTAMLEEQASGDYFDTYLVDANGVNIGQVYYASEESSLDAIEEHFDEIITVDVLYYTDHGDTIYLVFYGGESDITVATTDADKAAFYSRALELKDSFVDGTTFNLPATIGESTISWEPTTGELNVTVAAGVATFADVSADTAGSLTATITYPSTAGDVVVTRDFAFTILNITEADLVAADKAELDLDLTATELDTIVLPDEGTNESVITWEITPGDAAFFNDDDELVFDYTGVDATVELTATITNGAAFDTKVFTIAVTAATVSTIAEVLAGTNGDEFVVHGNVYYLAQYGYFIEDATGKLFVYATPEMLVGDEVAVKGDLATFQGSKQLSSYPVTSSVLSSDNDVTQTATVYDPATTTLVPGQSYTITGTVSWGPVETGGYDQIYFADASSDPLVMVYYKAHETSYELLESLVGVNVTLDLVYYNLDDIVSFVFMGTEDDITINADTDAEYIEAVLGMISIPEMVTTSGTIDFPLTAFGVNIAYASDMVAYISDAGIVNVVEGEQVLVTITLTGTYNEVEASIYVPVQVGALAVSDVADIYDSELFGDGDMIKVQGILTMSTKPSAFWLQDGTAGVNLYVPSDLRTEFAALALGTEISVVGEVDIMNGLYEVAYFTYEVENTVPALPSPTDITDVEFSNETLLPYQGQLVSLYGFHLSAAITVASGSNISFTLVSNADPSKTIPVFVDDEAPGYADLYTELTGYTTSDTLLIEGGIVGCFYNYQLLLSYADQVILGTNSALLDYDKTNLEVELTAMAQQTVMLPLEGKMGSTIAWTVVSGNSTLDVDGTTLLYNLASADYDVVLEATLSLGSEVDQTKQFTVSVTGYEVITDFSEIYAMTGEVYDIADDSMVYLQGVVIAFGFNQVYIQDENGVGVVLYKAEGYNDDGTINIGDEVVYYGEIEDHSYNGIRQINDVAELVTVVSEGNAVIEFNMTLDQIVALTPADIGKIITVSGLTVTNMDNYGYILFDAVGTTETAALEIFGADYGWVDELYDVDDVIGEVTFIFNKYYSGTTMVIELLTMEFDDDQSVTLDANAIDTAMILDEDMEIPLGEYGSTYTISAVSTELQAYVDITTPGWLLLVSQPVGADATGTITVAVNKDTATEQLVVVTVTIPQWVAVTYTETFSLFPVTGSSYLDGSYVGDDGFTWTYVGARGDQNIDGDALCLNKVGSNANANVSSTITGGIGSFSVQYKNAFSTAAGVKLYINDVLIDTSADVSDGTVTTFTVENINTAGEFTIKLMATNGQLSLDNLTWESFKQ